jgi:DNA-binding NarL/FixJ family response regulator
MPSVIQKIAAIIDPMNFRRARIESFLTAWAKYENVDLISIAPEQAQEKLGDDVDCRLLIYNAGSTPSSSPEILAELHELHALRPAAALVIVADDSSLDGVSAAVKAGAQGYFDNAMQPALALQALSFVLRGGTYIPPIAILAHHPGAITPHHDRDDGERGDPTSSGKGNGRNPLESKAEVFTLIEERHPAAKTLQAPMTARQEAVISCLCDGDSNKAIARKLGMTETAVKVHMREIMRKLGVFNRTQVALIAARDGLGSRSVAGLLYDGPVSSGRPH